MTTVIAQHPTHYPSGKDPVKFTTGNILVYIVFPVLLVAIWILIRRRERRKDRSNEN